MTCMLHPCIDLQETAIHVSTSNFLTLDHTSNDSVTRVPSQVWVFLPFKIYFSLELRQCAISYL